MALCVAMVRDTAECVCQATRRDTAGQDPVGRDAVGRGLAVRCGMVVGAVVHGAVARDAVVHARLGDTPTGRTWQKAWSLARRAAPKGPAEGSNLLAQRKKIRLCRQFYERKHMLGGEANHAPASAFGALGQRLRRI